MEREFQWTTVGTAKVGIIVRKCTGCCNTLPFFIHSKMPLNMVSGFFVNKLKIKYFIENNQKHKMTLICFTEINCYEMFKSMLPIRSNTTYFYRVHNGFLHKALGIVKAYDVVPSHIRIFRIYFLKGIWIYVE